MTRSNSDTGLTQRTYPMSERSRSILDQLSIVLPGYSKTDLMNVSVFWMASSLKDFRDERGLDIKAAFRFMEEHLSENGYEQIRENIMSSMKVTSLDRWFDRDSDGVTEGTDDR